MGAASGPVPYTLVLASSAERTVGILPFLLTRACAVNAHKLPGDAPCPGLLRVPPRATQHRQWVIPRGREKIPSFG